ncbi:ATP-binding protein [Anderseniella sp. Alg231-50]|uniref:ATP-binding protein n=1 Tax=Anderseniella sp. Alg231-50 TaxID=1922226 RepID=UPI00307B83F1
MSVETAPSLDELNNAVTPAWLWDGARLRIVWANAAGLAVFGCDSLFDLIDMPFDETDPGAGRVSELARTAATGESWQEMVSFASAVSDAPFSVTLHVHALADGRNGLLMVAETPPSGSAQAAQDTGQANSVLESLPVATVICSDDGAISYANAMARSLFGQSTPASLAEISEQDVAARIFDRARRAGIASSIATMATGYGNREIRVTAKLITLPDDTDGRFSLILEDVTERRALERALPASGMPVPAPATVGPAEQAETIRELRQAVEAATAQTSAGTPAKTVAPETPPAPARANAKPPARSSAPPARTAAPAAKTAGFGVADIVRKALSDIPKAIVLYRAGKLVYANQAIAATLGCASENDLAGRHDIAAALGSLANKQGTVTLKRRNGEEIELGVDKSTFPWNDGAMPMAILTETDSKKPNGPVAVPVSRSDAAQPDTTASPDSDTPRAAAVTQPAQSAEDDAKEPTAPTSTNAKTLQPEAQAGPQPAVSTSELMSILDTATDGIVFLADDGSITHMSAGAEALFGVHAASVIDKPLAGLMDKASAKVVRDYLAALGDSGLAMLFNGGREIIANVNDGGDVPIFITMRKIAVGMQGIPASAYCAVMRDITQWKKTEAELRASRDEAEHTSRQKSEFLARISHELRTPLNAILGFSDIMRNGQFGKLGSERYEGYANDIHTSGEYLLSLVNDLLDLSKVEAGKLELNFISVDLGQAIDSCIKLMQDEATGARVVLRKSVAPNLPQVVADIRSIKQVLLNLTSNAIKFTDPGGQVIITAKAIDTGELLLSVTDTGVGMDEEQLNTALEPFRRVEVAGRPEVQGTGLGLPLTKALVEANRASFEISSEARKGTRIDITFPTTRVLAS